MRQTCYATRTSPNLFGKFNDALLTAYVNVMDELGRICKFMAVAYCKEISYHFAGETEKSQTP